MFSYWAKPLDTLDLSQYLNDHVAQVVSENPKRFIGMWIKLQQYAMNIFLKRH